MALLSAARESSDLALPVSIAPAVCGFNPGCRDCPSLKP